MNEFFKKGFFLAITLSFIFSSMAFAMENDENGLVGWVCINIHDNGVGNQNHTVCENPGCNKKIRYVHTMKRNNNGDIQFRDVGNVCATKMDVNAKTREHNYKARQTPLKWKDINSGIFFRAKKTNAYNIMVWKDIKGENLNKFSYSVSEPSNKWFNTLEEAKQAAIDEQWPLYLDDNDD